MQKTAQPDSDGPGLFIGPNSSLHDAGSFTRGTAEQLGSWQPAIGKHPMGGLLYGGRVWRSVFAGDLEGSGNPVFPFDLDGAAGRGVRGLTDLEDTRQRRIDQDVNPAWKHRLQRRGGGLRIESDLTGVLSSFALTS